MDIESAVSSLNRDLTDLAARRAQLQHNLDETGQRIGATANTLHHLGQPKAQSAQRAGISPSHMTELTAKAAGTGVEIPDPLHQIPSLAGLELQAYVARHGGPSRVVAGFADWDPLHLSRVDPVTRLRNGDIDAPTMMIQCADQEWVAVDEVTVGYSGTGPANARSELLGLGIDERTADLIAHRRVSDVPLDASLTAGADSLFSNQWPHSDLGGVWYTARRLVVRINADGFGSDTDANYQRRRDAADTGGGFTPTPPRRHRLQAWLDRLDDPTIPWLQGPRRARAYLDTEAAATDGYYTLEDYPRRIRHVYSVIIEQGPIQLWLKIPRSNDPAQRFAPEVHTALAAAGFYTAPLDPTAGRGAFARWLSNFGRTPPPFVHLDDIPLRHPDPGLF